MPKVFRHVMPALFILAPFIFGSETAAARQSARQAPAAGSVEAAAAVSNRLAGAATESAASADPAALPALVDSAASGAARGVGDAGTCDAANDPAAAVRPAPALIARAPADARAKGVEKLFGYNAPPFAEVAAAETAGPQQQPAGQQPSGQQQPTGQQPGSQNPGNQPPDPIQPMTAGEKMKRALRSSFLSPMPYAFSAFSATLTQLREDELPDKDFEDELGDWGSRFARTFATRTTRSVFTNGVYASLFRQDPRYHRPVNKGFGARVAYAVSRVFVTRDDDGNTEPNYSRFAGSMTASALANVWERSTPGHDRIGTDATLRRFALYFVYDAASNVVFREIIPTVFGR